MNQIDLAGQTAVITGGAQGLGFAMARRIAASGAKVSLWDMDGDLLKKAAAELGGGAREELSQLPDAIRGAAFARGTGDGGKRGVDLGERQRRVGGGWHITCFADRCRTDADTALGQIPGQIGEPYGDLRRCQSLEK